MEDDRASLVMRDPDRGRRVAAAVVRPSNETSKHVLRPLKPFEANHRGCARLRISSIDCCISEQVYLFAGDSRFYRLGVRRQWGDDLDLPTTNAIALFWGLREVVWVILGLEA
jgi:hypothetical protein